MNAFILPKNCSPSTTQIQEQVTMIKEVAGEATTSKEFALQFLDDAGILELIIADDQEVNEEET